MESSHGYGISLVEAWECFRKKAMSQTLEFMEQVNVQPRRTHVEVAGSAEPHLIEGPVLLPGSF